MTTKTTKTKKPEPTPMTEQERIEYVLQQLRRRITRFEEQKQEMVQRLLDSPAYYLGWLGDFAIQAADANEVQMFLNGVEQIAVNETKKQDGTPFTITDLALEMHKDWTRRLLNNQYRASSTSAFSNANEEATREAISRLVRDYTFVELLPADYRAGFRI